MPRARVAFHTHMPYATALSMTEGAPLVWAGQTSLKFYGRTVVDEDYNGLALDHSEGARIAGSVGDADIVFMRNHGVMVLAPNVAEAWDDLYYLERAAQVQVLAMSTGRKIIPVVQPEATAFYIHAEIHKRVPRARVAFHTHMPYATALSMTEGAPLVWAGQTSLKFYGRTVVDEDYNGLALDHSEGARIAGSVGDADIVFMRNHGVMVLAPNVAEAWDDLYYLERAAQVQVLAMSTGRKIIPVVPQIAEAAYRQMREGDPESARLHLASIRRQLDAEEPQYRH